MTDDEQLDQFEKDICGTYQSRIAEIAEAEAHLAGLRAEYQRKIDWIAELRAKRATRSAAAHSRG